MAIHPILVAKVLIDAMRAKDDKDVPAYLGSFVLVGKLPHGGLTARPGVTTGRQLHHSPPALHAAGLSTDMVTWPLHKRGLGGMFGSASFKLGRDRDCDVVLPDVLVSHSHAVIILGSSQCSIRNAGSSNPTRINNEELTGERPLQDGDHLFLGGVELLHLTSARFFKLLRSGKS